MRNQTINCCGCNNVKKGHLTLIKQVCTIGSPVHIYKAIVLRVWSEDILCQCQVAIRKVFLRFWTYLEKYTIEHWYADFRSENIQVTVADTKREKKKPNSDTYDNKSLSASSLLRWMLMKHKSVSYCLLMYTTIIHVKGGHPKMSTFLVHVHP